LPKKESDKEQDAKVMRGMTPKEKAQFKKEDKKMDKKNPSKAKDKKMDEDLAKKIKSKKKK
jgi:hypothetical protein